MWTVWTGWFWIASSLAWGSHDDPIRGPDWAHGYGQGREYRRRGAAAPDDGVWGRFFLGGRAGRGVSSVCARGSAKGFAPDLRPDLPGPPSQGRAGGSAGGFAPDLLSDRPRGVPGEVPGASPLTFALTSPRVAAGGVPGEVPGAAPLTFALTSPCPLWPRRGFHTPALSDPMQGKMLPNFQILGSKQGEMLAIFQILGYGKK